MAVIKPTPLTTTWDDKKVMDGAMAVAGQMNAAVDQAYAPGLSYLEQQQANIPGQFSPYRNAADLQARVDAKTLDERMANMGLTSSGTNLTGQTAIDTTRQNVMGQITAAEAKTVQEVQAQIAQFIGQRDAKKAENIGTAMGKVQDARTQFDLSKAGAEIQFHYESMVQEQGHANTIELRNIDEQLMIAKENRDFAKTKELENMRSDLVIKQQREAAATQYSYAKKLADYNKTQTTAAVKTSLTKDERETIDRLTKGISDRAAAEGGRAVGYKDVAAIAKQYAPGTMEYNYAMAGIGMAGASDEYAYSAVNAASGSSTSAASAYGLTLVQNLGGGATSLPIDHRDTQGMLQTVAKKYTPGSANYNAALIAMGYGQFVTGAPSKAPSGYGTRPEDAEAVRKIKKK